MRHAITAMAGAIALLPTVVGAQESGGGAIAGVGSVVRRADGPIGNFGTLRDQDLNQLMRQLTNLPGFDAEAWRRKREQTIMPIGPQEASVTLVQLANIWRGRCADPDSLECLRANGLSSAADRLRQAAAQSPTCEQAANLFRDAYASAKPSSEVARAYDLACLGSFVPRKDAPAASLRPTILNDADQPGGMLSAVGLLERDGKIICAGLVRPDHSFLTARHCIEGAPAKGLTVRPALGQAPSVAVMVRKAAPWTKIGVAADWAVLQLPAGAPIAAAPTNLVALDQTAEVTVVAAYPYADATDYEQAAPMPRRALRFPQAGMCQALLSFGGCLQLACQTVRGFSGAPIFSRRKPDGSYDVVGFVSGSDGSDSYCDGTEAVSNSTFAVSPEVFDLAN